MKARFIDFDKTMRNKNGARNFFFICNMWETRGDVHVAQDEVIVTVE